MLEVDLAQGPPNDRQDFSDCITDHHLPVDEPARIHGLSPDQYCVGEFPTRATRPETPFA